MCNICKNPYGSNKHQIYWIKYFLFKRDFKKFIRSLYHFFNKKAYKKWMNKHYYRQHIYFGFLLCSDISSTEVPEEYVEYITNLDATDTLNEYYNLLDY